MKKREREREKWEVVGRVRNREVSIYRGNKKGEKGRGACEVRHTKNNNSSLVGIMNTR